MKKFSVLLWAALAFFFASYAQAPANDECSTAIELTPSAGLTCTSSMVNIGRANASQPLFSSSNACDIISVTNQDVWYRFTASQMRHRLQIDLRIVGRISAYELFSGTCGSLVPIACGRNGTSNARQFHNLENLVVGQTYFLRTTLEFCGANDQMGACLVDPLRPYRTVISTRQGGMWTSSSTWVGNEVPIENDTVIIDDGATVSLTPDEEKLVHTLQLGRGLRADPAKLVFVSSGPVVNGNPRTLTVKGDLIVNQAKDSLILNPLNVDRYALVLQGNWIHNGGLRYAATTTYRGADILFEGRGPVTVSGTGGFPTDMGNLQISKKGVVTWNVPMRIAGNLILYDGFLQVPAGFGVARPRLPYSTSYKGPYIWRNKGKLLGSLADTNNYSFLNLDYSEIFDRYNTPPFDSTIVAGPEFLPNQYFAQLQIVRNIHLPSSGPFVFPGKIRCRTLNYQKARIIASDSVIAHNLNFYGAVRDTFDYIDSPALRFYLSRSAQVDLAVGRNGYRRYLDLTENGSRAWGGWVDIEFLPGKPPANASYNMPITTAVGNGYVRISSKARQSLRADLTVGWFLKDSLGGGQLVLASSVLSIGTYTALNSQSQSLYLMQTNEPVVLNNLQHVIIAYQINPSEDIGIENVLFPPPYLAGCSRSQTVGVVVRNTGTVQFNTYDVGLTINGTTHQQSISLPPNGLLVQQTDTLYFSGASGIVPSLIQASTVEASVTKPNDVRANNNSLLASQVYETKEIPYQENFDTLVPASVIGPFSNWVQDWTFVNFKVPNLPFYGFTPYSPNTGTMGIGFRYPLYSAGLKLEAYTPAFTTPSNSSGQIRVGLQYAFNNLQAGDTLWVDVLHSCGDVVNNLRTYTLANAPLIPTSTLDLAQVPPGGPFYLRFRMVTAYGLGPGERSVFFDNLVIDQPANGLADGLSKAALKLYPNPAGAQLTLESQEAGQLFLLDLQGRVVHTHTLSDVGTTTLLVGDMPAGVYFYRYQTASGVSTVRWVKQ